MNKSNGKTFWDAASEAARKKIHAPEGWVAYRMEMLHDFQGNFIGECRVTGAIAPLYTRGEKKGRIHWKRKERNTVCTVTLTKNDLAAIDELLQEQSLQQEEQRQ